MSKKIKTVYDVDNIYNDIQFEDDCIKNATKEKSGYSIELMNGWSIFLDKKYKIIPEAGDDIRLYGKGIGSNVRGIAINDIIVYYRTEKQEQAKHIAWCKAEDNKKKAEFKKNKTKIDKRFKALPEVFQNRINRFRKGNKNFRWEYEPYEMFCCEEALVIVKHLKTENDINDWVKLDYKNQIKLVPISDNHSGNTFGCSVMLAKLYLTKPELIEKVHGALAPLVGCKVYGCTHEKTI